MLHENGFYISCTHHVNCTHLLTKQTLLKLVLAALLPELRQLLIGHLHLFEKAVIAVLQAFISSTGRKIGKVWFNG